VREQREGVQLRKGFDGGTKFGRWCDTVVVRKGFHDEKRFGSEIGSEFDGDRVERERFLFVLEREKGFEIYY